MGDLTSKRGKLTAAHLVSRAMRVERKSVGLPPNKKLLLSRHPETLLRNAGESAITKRRPEPFELKRQTEKSNMPAAGRW